MRDQRKEDMFASDSYSPVVRTCSDPPSLPSETRGTYSFFYTYGYVHIRIHLQFLEYPYGSTAIREPFAGLFQRSNCSTGFGTDPTGRDGMGRDGFLT